MGPNGKKSTINYTRKDTSSTSYCQQNSRSASNSKLVLLKDILSADYLTIKSRDCNQRRSTCTATHCPRMIPVSAFCADRIWKSTRAFNHGALSNTRNPRGQESTSWLKILWVTTQSFMGKFCMRKSRVTHLLAKFSAHVEYRRTKLFKIVIYCQIYHSRIPFVDEFFHVKTITCFCKQKLCFIIIFESVRVQGVPSKVRTFSICSWLKITIKIRENIE